MLDSTSSCLSPRFVLSLVKGNSLKHPFVGVDIEGGDKKVSVGGKLIADDGDVGTASVLLLDDGGSTFAHCPKVLRAQFRWQTETINSTAAEHCGSAELSAISYYITSSVVRGRSADFSLRVFLSLHVYLVVFDAHAPGATQT